MLRKYIIKQAYRGAVENLKSKDKPILNSYIYRMDDLFDNIADNEAKKDVLFYLNNKIYFIKPSEINSI